MKDKELADKVVELGVLRRYKDGDLYTFDRFSSSPYNAVTAKFAICDWRVAGPLMEKCVHMGNWMRIYSGRHRETGEEGWFAADWYFASSSKTDESGQSKSLPAAITAACVEALS